MKRCNFQHPKKRKEAFFDMRTFVNEIKAGKDVELLGWVHEIRDLAKIKFVLLRDYTGIVQCFTKNEKLFKKISELTLESIVKIKGTSKKADVKYEDAIHDIEIEIKDIELLNKAEDLPIQVLEKAITTGLSKRLDYRYLDIRKPKIKAIFKIQSEIANSFREFFRKENFIEIQPPCIITTSTEGGSDLFKVKYFDKDAYLAQSPQLYKQLVAISLEKVFLVMPIWRAEKHNTVRHLTEIRQMDIEMAFADDMDVMKLLTKSIQYIVKSVIKNCSEELKILNLKLKVPEEKYLSYKETIELLKKNKIAIKDGEDLTPEAEKKLSELFPDTIVFVHSWPQSLKPFYIWPKENGLSGGFDAIYGGMELASGGQRIHIPKILIKNIKAKGMNPENFKWYVDAFRYGAPKHSGWSYGIERLTMILCKLDNIREGTLFPRDPDRLKP